MFADQLRVLSYYVQDLEPNAIVAELGACCGLATVTMLRANPNLYIKSYDWFETSQWGGTNPIPEPYPTWIKKDSTGETWIDAYSGFVEQTREYKDRIEMISGEFLEQLNKSPDHFFDFILWDGDHNTVKKQTEIIKEIRNKLKPNALCVVDDVQMDIKMKAIRNGLNKFKDMRFELLPYNLGIISFNI